MPLTNDYYRYTWTGTCNTVASPSCNIAALSRTTCAVGANAMVYEWNVRTGDKVRSVVVGMSVTCLCAGVIGTRWWRQRAGDVC
jgi:hypothetical protein